MITAVSKILWQFSDPAECLAENLSEYEESLLFFTILLIIEGKFRICHKRNYFFFSEPPANSQESKGQDLRYWEML